MNPRPNGTLHDTGSGRDLLITRTFRAGIDDVWASITESERTARWFASWTGEAGPGRTIRYRLVFEEGAPEEEMTIEACTPPTHLAVASKGEYAWRLEARLTETAGTTVLTLVHHLPDDIDIGSVGPGWEYYLDMLVASRDGDARPSFDDYYPAQQEYYQQLRPEEAGGA